MSQDPKKTVSRESDKFMLRFPQGMREEIASAAKASGRSMNSEIIERIENSAGKTPEGLIALLVQLQERATKAEFMVSSMRHMIASTNDMIREYVEFAHPEAGQRPKLDAFRDNLLSTVDIAEELISGPGGAPDREQLYKNVRTTFDVWEQADKKLKTISEQQKLKLEQEIKKI